MAKLPILVKGILTHEDGNIMSRSDEVCFFTFVFVCVRICVSECACLSVMENNSSFLFLSEFPIGLCLPFAYGSPLDPLIRNLI